MKIPEFLEIKHIPFIQIDCPPSHFALRVAKEKATEKFKKHKFGNDTFIRWAVEEEEKNRLLDNYSSFKTVYVSISDLMDKIKDREEGNLIGITHPALTD